MTLTRKLIIAFWVFIVVMLLWEFYNYNASMTQQAVEHPQQTQFFHYQPATGPAPAPKKVYHGAALEQVGFVVLPDTPTPGQFTCQVTLKNMGTETATGIQVRVRPYRGIPSNDVDVARTNPKPIDDSNPLAQISQWISFPDIEPGKSATQSATFIATSGVKPGTNPDPEIQFETAKKPQEVRPQDNAPRRPLGG